MNRVRLSDILEYEQPSKYIVKSDQYKDDYKIPVLTAGKTFILGYTNESEGIYNASPENPIILFDDFTTECRYIDFDFKVKSSAVKILKPIGKVNLKYIYYVLKSIVYDTTSHKRYWISQYSNFLVTLPDAEFQKKVVEKLEKIENLISIKKKELLKLDELTKAQFVEMFGDPQENEKKWIKDNMGNYLSLLTDFSANGSYAKLDSIVKMYDEPNYAYMVRTTDLEKKDFINDVKYIDENAYNTLEKSKIYGNEIIMCKIGSAGKVYLMPVLDKPVSLGRNAFMFRYNDNINPKFIYFLLTSEYGKNEINQYVRGAVTKTITKDDVRKVKIIVPPIELQNKFEKYIELIDKQKSICNKEIKRINELMETQKLKYFGGVISE